MELVTSALAKSMAGWNSSRPHAVSAQIKEYIAQIKEYMNVKGVQHAWKAGLAATPRVVYASGIALSLELLCSGRRNALILRGV